MRKDCPSSVSVWLVICAVQCSACVCCIVRQLLGTGDVFSKVFKID